MTPEARIRDRRGLTIVELLVVFAIVGLLLSLLLPAVSQSRETARRMQCASNLRALGLSLTSYSAQNAEVLPPGLIKGPGSITASQFVLLLPHFEQEQLYDSYNFERPNSSVENVTVRATRVQTLLCPSLPLGEPHKLQAASAYAGNYGSGTFERPDGVFGKRQLNWSDLKDGASKTASFSEWIPTSPYGSNPPIDQRGTGLVLNVEASFENREQFLRECLKLTPSLKANFEAIGWDWTIGYVGITWYDHSLTPNQRSCVYSSDGSNGRSRYAYTVSSYHSGGVNLAFADGHIEWFSDSIDTKIWRAMSTREGGETF